MVNPMFNDLRKDEEVLTKENIATYRGITIKTLIFLAISIISAIVFGALLWNQMRNGQLQLLIVGTTVFGIVGFISAIIGRSRPRSSFSTGVIYAVCEGGFLGMISLIGEMFYPGIVLMAAISTVVVFFVMLAIFASGVIRNKSKFMSFAISLGSSVIILILATMLLGLFMPAITNSLPVIILVESLVTIYGCVCLLANFIEANALVQSGFTKEYEWSCAFGLMISILYIYLQILRILMIILELAGKNN